MRVKLVQGWYWESLCLLVYLALTIAQLLVPPIVGLADNGDFPKVLSPQDVCDPEARNDTFSYVHPKYEIRPECYWDSRLPSDEWLFVKAIKQFAEWAGRASFRITGAGKAHLPVLAIALAILLWALHTARPALRFGLPPLAIWIFSDVAYVAYLNSFYMDVASLEFLLATVSLAAAWILRPKAWVAIGYGVAGALLGYSKTQHAITALLLALVAGWFAVSEFRRRQKRYGWCWAASAMAIAASAATIIYLTPADYKAEPLYSLIFFRILPGVPNAAQAIGELGLPASDLELVGTHAYSPRSPIMQNDFRLDFIHEVTYRGLAEYYLYNPRVTLHLIWRGMKEDVPSIRPYQMGNYQREDGFPPRALAKHFDSWSTVRTGLLRFFPAFTVLFYAVMGAGSLGCVFRRSWSERWPLYPLVLALTAGGTVEFLFAVMLDGTENDRHLFLFQVTSEILNVCAVAALLCLRQITDSSKIVSREVRPVGAQRQS